jgi:hypothetical protein
VTLGKWFRRKSGIDGGTFGTVVPMSVTSAPTNCFVAMFDILGFKALRKRCGTAGLHQLYTRSISAMIAHAAAGSGKTSQINGESLYVPHRTPFSPHFQTISDTAIFFTRDDSFISFLNIVHSSFCLLQFGFAGSKAPYRGAIGWGDLIADKSGILIGTAVEDAYDGQGKQAWAGCMLTEECQRLAVSMDYLRLYREFHLTAASELTDESKRRGLVDNAERLVEYPVHLQENPKDGPAVYFRRKTHVIDWTIRMHEGAAAKSFEPSEKSHAREIARNTIEFENWARERRR